MRCVRMLAVAVMVGSPALAQSNVNATNKFAWGENIGWTNWRDANGGAQGVVVNTGYLRGFIWGENIGWINTGNGNAPYANTNNTNFGVNIDPVTGYTSGLAWGENVGWINFATRSAVGDAQGARFDFAAGRFRGFAWGENIGWINLDNGTRFVSAVPVCCPGNADKAAPGNVSFPDVTAILLRYGSIYGTGTGIGDADCNGLVDFDDITSVLLNYLDACP